MATDVSGGTAEEVYYYPFGATRDRIGNVSLNHKYTSQELDPESGLYYYGARYYDPELGRFLTPDSIVPYPNDPQSFPPQADYSYVRNNPLNSTDPDGQFFFAPIIIGAIVGAVVGSTVAAVTGGDVFKGALFGAAFGAAGGAAGAGVGALATANIAADVMYSSSAITAGAFIGGATAGPIGGAISPTISQPANPDHVLHLQKRAPEVQKQPEDYYNPSNSGSSYPGHGPDDLNVSKSEMSRGANKDGSLYDGIRERARILNKQEEIRNSLVNNSNEGCQCSFSKLGTGALLVVSGVPIMLVGANVILTGVAAFEAGPIGWLEGIKLMALGGMIVEGGLGTTLLGGKFILESGVWAWPNAVVISP